MSDPDCANNAKLNLGLIGCYEWHAEPLKLYHTSNINGFADMSVKEFLIGLGILQLDIKDFITGLGYDDEK